VIRLNNNVEFVPLDTDLADLPGSKPLLTVVQNGEKFLVHNDTANQPLSLLNSNETGNILD